MTRALTVVLASALVALAATGCGSSTQASGTPASAPSGSSTATTSSSGPGALTGEAGSAATGDIPDNQAFLTYHNAAAGYSIVYPEGWARKGAANDVTFADKNNLVHVVIASGPPPTPSRVAAELAALKRSNPTLTFTAPRSLHLKAGAAVKATYTTRSAPNPVTGKTVLLVVDRYELNSAGKRATVDLGSPKGVDNVDAYRRIINSFAWR